ncbi:hypothetical protein LCGC14_2840850, partial [marine sediment metagenome]
MTKLGWIVNRLGIPPMVQRFEETMVRGHLVGIRTSDN